MMHQLKPQPWCVALALELCCGPLDKFMQSRMEHMNGLRMRFFNVDDPFIQEWLWRCYWEYGRPNYYQELEQRVKDSKFSHVLPVENYHTVRRSAVSQRLSLTPPQN